MIKANQPSKWQEANAKETPKKSSALHALAIVVLFIVLLIANDLVLYRFLVNSNRSEDRFLENSNGANSTPSPFDEEKSTG